MDDEREYKVLSNGEKFNDTLSIYSLNQNGV